MREFTGIMCTTHVNRKNEQFTLEALQDVADRTNADGGLPQLVSHDWSRLIGWTERLWIEPLEDGEHALHFDAWLPETDEEEARLRERFEEYTVRMETAAVAPFEDALRALSSGDAVAIFVFDCVGLIEAEIAAAKCPDLVTPDDEGLVPVINLEAVERGLFTAGDYVLSPHWMLRRYAYRRNSVNDTLVGTLKRLDGTDGLSCRIRLDGDFVGLAVSLERVGECDYWWGPPYTGKLTTQPEGVICHGANEKIRTLEMLDRAEVYLYRRDGETVVQVEEVHDTPLIREYRGDEFRLERYAHLVLNDAGDVIHLDGAMRLYTEDQWEQRRSMTLADAGAAEAEHRVKMFAVDGVTTEDTAVDAICAFFRGNPLVPEAFGLDLDAAHAEQQSVSVSVHHSS